MSFLAACSQHLQAAHQSASSGGPPLCAHSSSASWMPSSSAVRQASCHISFQPPLISGSKRCRLTSTPLQAIPLIRSDADHPLYKIRNPDSVKYDGAAAMLLPAIDSTVSARAAGAGAGFNYEYESGLCIILRLLARFVDVAHKSASLSVPFTVSSFVTFIDSGIAPSAVDDVAAGVAGAGMASAMQVKHALQFVRRARCCSTGPARMLSYSHTRIARCCCSRSWSIATHARAYSSPSHALAFPPPCSRLGRATVAGCCTVPPRSTATAACPASRKPPGACL